MKEIGGVAVTGQPTQRRGSAASRVPARFEDEKRGGFAEEQAGAVQVEGPAFFDGRGLETIEADEDQLGQRFEAAGQNAVGRADGNQVGGVADGVGAAGAGVGDDDGWTRKAERLLQIEDLLLRQDNGRPG